ncbi:MAG: c-type cytochrome [Deltaproteobacteria bacterium]|nr:c-type cytochrome [Deltaproteobacteria bacterium]
MSGGTLAVTLDGAEAIASDPDTDRVLIVGLADRSVTAVSLRPGDEPGRVVVDDHRRAHVALRRGGAVVTLELDSRTITARREVCRLPRGLAWDPVEEVLHVACAGGELVTLPTGDGPPTRTVRLERDLRDVVVHGNRLYVTRFRSAEVLVLDEGGAVVGRARADLPRTAASVAWRAVPSPRGGLWLLHQRVGDAPVALTAAGYYSSHVTYCTGTEAIARPGLAWVRPPAEVRVLPELPFAPLAVDVAAAPSAERLAVAIPGNWGSAERPQVIETSTEPSPVCMRLTPYTVPRGQVVAVAYGAEGALWVQTRAPATLVRLSDRTVIELGGPAMEHAGHRLFHSQPAGLMTCASCHPEGGDDGRNWTFAGLGIRRTQNLLGGVLETAPFHWDGDLMDFSALLGEVMVRRMRARAPSPSESNALERWVDALPPLPASDRGAAAARGEALFRSEAVGCAGCHSGRAYTNGQTVAVGTGGPFQVPTLRGLAWRAPYMHNGCAATLRDRFGPCGGGEAHGHTAHLLPAQLEDLLAFLESL